MITDEVSADLQADLLVENAALREQLAAALWRISELETKRSQKTRKASRTEKSGKAGKARVTRDTRDTWNISTLSHVGGHAGAITKRELKRRVYAHNQTQLQRRKELPVRPSVKPNVGPSVVALRSIAPHPKREYLPDDVQVKSARQVENIHQPQIAAAVVHRASTLWSAASNTIMLLSGQLITWGSALVLTAAYGRFLGAQGLGELFLATTFTALVGFPIEFSFNQQLVRDVAQDPRSAHRYLTTALALKGALWVVLFAFGMLLTIALGYSPLEQWLIAICGLMMVTTAISTALIAIQTAYMQVGFAKFGVVIEKGIDTVLAVLLLRAGAGVQAVALVLLFGSCVDTVWQIWRVARIIGIHLVWDTQIARTLIRSGLSFLVYGVLGVIYYRVDAVLLSVMGTDAAVGVYGAAYRLLDALTFVPSIVIGAVVAPIMAKHFADSETKLRLTVEKSTLAMLLCSAPATAGLLVAAPNIIWFIYHRSDFAGSISVLQALAIGLIALYLNSVLTTVLISTGQERKLPIMAGAALIFNVALNLALIPRFMGVGAAWATTLTEALLLGIGVALIDRRLIPVRLWVGAGKIALASLVMALVVHEMASFNIIVIISVAAVVYCIAIAALRVIPNEDLAQIKVAVAQRFKFRGHRDSGASRTLAHDMTELAIGPVTGELEAVR
jgi:O-antigen/teichoic acid export membrane protein